ncbi:MAG: tRNA dihydrouridine synthase DusB [bacterium]|nr:tRNA dihydrouridine synthase DusB [bacterium]
MIPMLRLGDLPIDPPLFLAPMAGLSDRDFRLMVRRLGGVGVVAMEFISSRELVDGHPRARGLMRFRDEERPLAIQIYGSAAATMAEAARRVEASGADICDVNMGCPAHQVRRGRCGAALMGDLRLAEKIIAAVRRTIRLPLTVKFRLGLDDRRRNFLELGRICEAQGVDAVVLHARTAAQGFRGEPQWSAIARLKEALGIPVIGNGDVAGPDDAVRMLRETGCDGVMVGRGALRNPWIFRQIAARLAHDEIPQPDLAQHRELILRHFRTVIAREDPKAALHKLRTFTGWYSQGLPNGELLRRRIQSQPDAESLLQAVVRFFDRIEIDKAA